MTTRREIIVVVGAGAVVAPFLSLAQQQARVWRVGFIAASSAASLVSRVEAFRAGLRDLGYVEGKNLAVEYSFADGKYERLPGLASELVRLKVDVIVAPGTPAVGAAQKATTTIAIVMVSTGDPVGSGFVKSLARPGSNITGLSNFAGDISPKLLEMLLAVVPKVSRVAVLLNPENPAHKQAVKNVQAAARQAGVTILPLEARNPAEIDSAFTEIGRQKAGGLIVMRDPFLNQQLRQVAGLATRNRLPTIGGLQEYSEAGGLMSYGQDVNDSFRRAATYVDKILKGTKPADLPVEQATRLELVINRKTAKALGLTIPQSILVRADKVIE